MAKFIKEDAEFLKVSTNRLFKVQGEEDISREEIAMGMAGEMDEGEKGGDEDD